MAKFLEASADSALSSPVSIASRVLKILSLTSGRVLNIFVVYLVSRSKMLRIQAFAVAVQIAFANLIIITLLGIPLFVRLINPLTAEFLWEL